MFNSHYHFRSRSYADEQAYLDSGIGSLRTSILEILRSVDLGFTKAGKLDVVERGPS